MKMASPLDGSYTADALNTDPKFSTPHFITLLMRDIKKDGDHQSYGIQLVMRTTWNWSRIFINGKSHYRLPVVYISRTFYDEDPVNVNFPPAV